MDESGATSGQRRK